MILHRNVSYYGYVTNTDIFNAKQLIFAEISGIQFYFVNISEPQKLSARPYCFWELGSQISPLFAALHQQ